MIEVVPAHATLSPRAGFVFLCCYIAALALCLAVPRALSFLPASVSLCAVVYLWAKHRRLPVLPKTVAAFFGLFAALAVASSFWSPDPDYALEKSLKIVAVFLSGLLSLMMANAIPRDTEHKNRIVIICVSLCALMGAILCFEYTFRFPVTRFVLNVEHGDIWPHPISKGFIMNRSSVFLVLLSLPMMLMMRTSDLSIRVKHILSCILAFGVGAMLLVTNSQTAQIAAVIAISMLFYPAHKLKARRVIMFTVIILMLAVPFLMKPAQEYLLPENIPADSFLIKASVPHRLEVWNFVSDEIKKSPLFGHGIEATRYLKADKMMPLMRADNVLHPHNAILQIWVEFGLIGILLTMGFVAYLLCALDNKPAILQRYNIVFFIVLLGVLSMGYGLWQAWLIGMIQTLAALGLMAAKLTGIDQPAQK